MELEERLSKQERLMEKSSNIVLRLSIEHLKLVEKVIELEHKLEIATASPEDFK